MNLSSEGSPGHRWRVCSEGLVFHTCFPSFWFPCQEAKLACIQWHGVSQAAITTLCIFKVIDR